MASNDEGATLLIPDLQRPYFWKPLPVIVLIDSLIRGWPFGTLLTWKVGPNDPARDLARPFWKVVSRISSGRGQKDAVSYVGSRAQASAPGTSRREDRRVTGVTPPKRMLRR